MAFDRPQRLRQSGRILRLSEDRGDTYPEHMKRISIEKVAQMSQRELLAIWARIAAHEDALRALHAAVDRGIQTLADGLELALGKLAALDPAKRTRVGRGRKRGSG